MASTIKKISLYSIPIIVGNLIPIITLPLFTRHISVTDFGIFALAQTIGTYLGGIAVFGTNIGFERNFFEKDDQQYISQLFYTVLMLTFGSFTIIGLLFIIAQKYVLSIFHLQSTYETVFIYSYFGLGIVNIKHFFLIYLKNIHNVKSYVWFSLDEIILGFIFQVCFVLCFKMGIVGLALGQFLASAIVFILLIRKFLKEMPFQINFKLVPNLMKISLPMTPRIFFGVFGNQFDKYMLGLIGSMNGVGIYNLGQRIGYLTFVFMNALQNIFSPVVYKTMFDESVEQASVKIGKYLTKYFYLSAGFGVLVILFAHEVITLLTPPDFHGAINIVSMLTIYYVSCFFGKQPQLIYTKKTGISTSLSFFFIGITVLVNSFVIPRWGVYGAALGTLFSGLLSNIIIFLISQYYYPIRWEYLKIAIIFAMLVGAAILQHFVAGLYLGLILSVLIKIGLIVLFALLGMFLNIIDIKHIFLILIKKFRPAEKQF